MLDLIVSYGPAALTWVLAALGALLARYVFVLVKNAYINGVLQRAWTEVQGAVLEVAQTYVDAIKKGKADGTLTDREKVDARALAISIAKANLGPKGLARLARVLDLNIDQWLSSKTEQAVKLLAVPDPRRPA